MFFALPFIALFSVGVACSLIGCIVPLAAIAAVTASALRLRDGLLLVAGVWFANQFIGFAVHGYPVNANTLAWAAALALGTGAAFFVARAVKHPLIGFASAFAAFELVLMLFSVPLGGWDAYAPRVLFEVFAVNAVWFAAAYLVLRVVSRGFDLDPSRR
ncbi:MAG TPA: hypothetical protein VMF11_11085 [Candidatus Baltobacteraceae bacterium]|nr:hypothetical protein [Candidatus Baltobacteraceae bacterium]